MNPTTDQTWPDAPLAEQFAATIQPLLLAFSAESLATPVAPAPLPPGNRSGYNHYGIND